MFFGHSHYLPILKFHLIILRSVSVWVTKTPITAELRSDLEDAPTVCVPRLPRWLALSTVAYPTPSTPAASFMSHARRLHGKKLAFFRKMMRYASVKSHTTTSAIYAASGLNAIMVDGHNVEELISVFEAASNTKVVAQSMVQIWPNSEMLIRILLD
ncbi:hypothetical protein OESDEN_07181 [Oesophagostomum dentatum]|uniref:Uncharacterized protein n=1 Tax=Oesophagostomum dentatum TaxID=61180 RepID=A0A0B1T9T3_OESDE|nr:hypothetical protein OESDEN_07181 [Oesophagostomum dentatum]